MRKDRISSMMCLDMYLSTLDDHEYQQLLPHLKQTAAFPLNSWDIYGNFLGHLNMGGNKKEVLPVLWKFAAKYDWKADLYSILDRSFSAVILTDMARNILWTSKGFTHMTGYSAKEVLGKSPSFLQGMNTSVASRNRIREQLALKHAFTETIVNYRKDNTEYLCEMSFFPINNRRDETTHFMALERVAGE